eukprot:TRINITY_DN13168_c0_g1_i1.p1 TRINITY_DN13168_c0_g1~~TRINITY_DN13168_c0_g1_i1.p1  ORF type:complete len:826 (-),score=143.36 TRINITY_DN13168_c0_g1_i1:20-2497(-)
MGNRALCGDASVQCAARCRHLGHRDDILLADNNNRCEPTGAVFDETLRGLRELDRDVLLFAAAGRVSAVRWLLELGASRNARDVNGTTCLHAASRGGSASVVASLVSDSGINATDVAGWTPLHIATFMGRADVAAVLLRSRASVEARNVSGFTPLDLCNDSRTANLVAGMAASRSAESCSSGAIPEHSAEIAEAEVEIEDVTGLTVGGSRPSSASQPLGAMPCRRQQISTGAPPGNGSDAQFQPYFVPRRPVFDSTTDEACPRSVLNAVGQAIFARDPGRGLAFLVASGATRDYPIDVVAMLRGGAFDALALGHFLGEEFSLAKILRFEFLNSIGFLDCGVVKTLAKAFANFGLPLDLQKVDRILASLAEIWWRQHQREGLATMSRRVLGVGPSVSSQPPRSCADESPSDTAASASSAAASSSELAGVTLHRLLPGPSVLHELMLSTAMLHWNLHPREAEGAKVDLGRWLALNDDLLGATPAGDDGGRLRRILVPIYGAISSRCIPCLQRSASVTEGATAFGVSCQSCAANPAAAPGGSVHDAAVALDAGAMDAEASTPLRLPEKRASGSSASSQGANDDLTALSQVAGWVRMAGGGLADMGRWQVFVEATHSARTDFDARSQSTRVMDDATGDSSRAEHGGDASSAAAVVGVAPMAALRPEEARRPQDLPLWACLCNSLLFFSLGKELAPFAFVRLAGARFAGLEPAAAAFTLEMGAEEHGCGSPTSTSNGARRSMTLVVLQPDGRWRVAELPQVGLELLHKSQLEAWVLALSSLSTLGAMASSSLLPDHESLAPTPPPIASGTTAGAGAASTPAAKAKVARAL